MKSVTIEIHPGNVGKSFTDRILAFQKMVKIGLQIKAFMENVTGLVPDGEDFRCHHFELVQLPELAIVRWQLKLKCNSCGEVPEHWQYLTQEERVQVKVRVRRTAGRPGLARPAGLSPGGPRRC